MKKRYTTYGILCKLPLGGSLWGLLFFFIFITACTEEAAETDPLLQQERYVTVRMNIPGMTINASRAADGVIESVTALAFDSANKLLGTRTATNLTQSSFNLTIPNGTKTIHFLGNLPDNYDLSGVNEESDLCNLTSNDFGNTRYWGMTAYNGETTLNDVTLYRDMARIKVVPADDSYTEDQIIIAGLLNPNNTGKIVPYKNGFNFNLNTNDYHTLPDDVEVNEVYEGTYSNPLYVFEHDNPATDEGLYVICKIAGYYYKVALLDNEGKPYDIIRNHEYTIYVSDLDVGETSYAAAKNAAPINPPVVDTEIQEITLTVNPTTASLYYDSDNTQQITVTVPDGKTLTALTIKPSVDCFTINPVTGGLTGPANGVYTYAPDGGVTGSVTFTIVPKSGYDFANVSSSILTFGGIGENMNVTEGQTEVTLSKKPEEVVFAVNPTNATINMDNGETSATLTLTRPANVNSMKVSIPDNPFSSIEATNYSWDDGNNYYYYGMPNNVEEKTFTFTVKADAPAGDYTITFYNDANNPTGNAQATITIVNTSVEEPEVSQMSVTPETATINLNSNGEKSTILTLSKPADVTAIKINHAGKFNIEVLNLTGYGSNDDGNNLYLNGTALESGAKDIQLKFTPKAGVDAGSYSITISEQNDDTNSVSATITLANLGTGTEIWNGNKTLGTNNNDESQIVLSYNEISQYAGWTMTIVLTTEGSDWKQIIVEKLSNRGNMLLQVNGTTLNTSYSFIIPSTSELNDNGLIIYGQGGITVTNIYVEETDAS